MLNSSLRLETLYPLRRREVAPRVVIRRARNGEGLFATRAYQTNQTIIQIVGRRVDAQILWDLGGQFADNCFRYGPETYLDPGDGPGRYLNHSCEPNAGIRKTNHRLFLFAASPIRAGREILIDYSTILGDDDIWTMRCNCGRRACRGRIRRFGSLPSTLQQRYLQANLVPRYVIDTLR